MKRRHFIALLGGVAAWPVGAQAQQPALPVVGFLSSASPEPAAQIVAAFRQGLSEGGYVEGQNVAVEYRWAHNENDRLPELAADLLRRNVAVIATPGSATVALAAKATTATVPIVFQMGEDPVKLGLVASLKKPGGNVTGFTSLNVDITAKRLDLLHELVPGATRFAVLVNPNNPSAAAMINEAQAAASTLGQNIEALSASSDREIDQAFLNLAQRRVDALVVTQSPLFYEFRARIAMLAARHIVPTIYVNREFPAAGGLMSYGSSNADQYRQVGIYVARILGGEKPADLAVQQVTTLELVINLKTAKALGIAIPLTLRARTDEVIE